MKLIISIFLIVFSANAFAQNGRWQYADLTHWGNYNPPDDSAVDTGWLIVGFFFYLHNHGGGPILSAYGIGVYYDTRKFAIDTEGREKENRRIIHKKKLKQKI